MFLLLDGAENFEANEPQGKTPITLEPLEQMDNASAKELFTNPENLMRIAQGICLCGAFILNCYIPGICYH